MDFEWLITGEPRSFHAPLVMGVLNVTPDSFFDGGSFADSKAVIEHGLKLLSEGAEILDVGGESTRPGSGKLEAKIEIERVLPVIEAVLSEMPDALVSIDTRKVEVAKLAVGAGAAIVNDVSGFRSDPAMLGFIESSSFGYVLMHMLGTPESMQKDPSYEDVVSEVSGFLSERMGLLSDAGVDLRRVVIDPGIGFGKLLTHNIELIRGVPCLLNLGRPVLVGASRKSMLGEITGRAVDDRLASSIAVALLAAEFGASILRVHDVRETVDALKVLEAFERAGLKPEATRNEIEGARG